MAHTSGVKMAVFIRRAFLLMVFIEDSGTCCFIIILGAIHKYILIVMMV